MGIQIVKDVLEAVVFLTEETAVLDVDKAIRLIGHALAILQDIDRQLLLKALFSMLDVLQE